MSRELDEACAECIEFDRKLVASCSIGFALGFLIGFFLNAYGII